MYKVAQQELNLNGAYKSMEWYAEKWDTKVIEGFQFRYIYLIDKTCQITVPILPFSTIDEIGGGMYKGEKITLAERKQAVEAQEKCV